MPRNEAVALNAECTRCEVAAEARQFVRVYPQPMRLTGAGMAELAAVRPYAVDVASGVEASPGIKDPAKVEAFIAAARPAGVGAP